MTRRLDLKNGSPNREQNMFNFDPGVSLSCNDPLDVLYLDLGSPYDPRKHTVYNGYGVLNKRVLFPSSIVVFT